MVLSSTPPFLQPCVAISDEAKLMVVKDGEGEADCLPTTDSGGEGGCRSCIFTVAGGREPGLVALEVVEWRRLEARREEMAALSMIDGCYSTSVLDM